MGPFALTENGKRHKNTAYNQQGRHLLCLPGEGVNNGHNIIEYLVFTRGELEHAVGNKTAGAHSEIMAYTECMLESTHTETFKETVEPKIFLQFPQAKG